MHAKVAVVFGGRSVEHEVSVITGHQIIEALAAGGHEAFPFYVTKDGEWLTSPELSNIAIFRDERALEQALERATRLVIRTGKHRGGFFSAVPTFLGRFRLRELPVDVVFPAIHGSFGEDGALQGVLEWTDLPYVGSDVGASALAMNKLLSKRLFEAAGIPVLPGAAVDRGFFLEPDRHIDRALSVLGGLPVVVKPCNLGSSIGVASCSSIDEVRQALELALELDFEALLEPALQNFYEINCSVLGPPSQASVCEMPRTEGDLLSFDEKYVRGKKGGTKQEGMASLDRVVPAPIPEEETAHLQALAIKAFDLIGAAGVARVDFLIDRERSAPFLNEINTIPGSMAFYLWEETGLPFDKLVTQLLEISKKRHREKQATVFSFETPLLTG